MPGLLAEVVRACLRVKGAICEADPREDGRRMALNLGHTFGHALESWAGFRGRTHGEAVAWGMGRAAALGTILGVTDPAFARGSPACSRPTGTVSRRRSARASWVRPCGSTRSAATGGRGSSCRARPGTWW